MKNLQKYILIFDGSLLPQLREYVIAPPPRDSTSNPLLTLPYLESRFARSNEIQSELDSTL